MILWGEYILKCLESALQMEKMYEDHAPAVTNILRLKLHLVDSIRSLLECQVVMLDGINATIGNYDPIMFSRLMRKINDKDIRNISRYLFEYGLLFKEYDTAMTKLTTSRSLKRVYCQIPTRSTTQCCVCRGDHFQMAIWVHAPRGYPLSLIMLFRRKEDVDQ